MQVIIVKKVAESKLIRKQRVKFSFLGTFTKKLLLVKDFQYQKMLKVHVLILNSTN